MVLSEKTRTRISLASYIPQKLFQVSTSRFGTGQIAGSNCTPLGLHRIRGKNSAAAGRAERCFAAGEWLVTPWNGMADAAIAHRILWLEGLEPGFNRGGKVDTFERYIIFMVLETKTTLGRPASRGCIHLRAADLIPAV
jgi:hypothetical protein